MGVANAVNTGVVQVTCTTGTYGTGWDNSNQFFEGKGNIAALYCQLIHNTGYISDNLTDPQLRWYQGLILTPQTPPDSHTVETIVETHTPQVVESATPPSSPVETPTVDGQPISSESSTPVTETSTPPSLSVDSSTPSSEPDSVTVPVDTGTSTLDTSTVTTETGTVEINPLPTPPPVVEPQPVPVPVPPVAVEPPPAPQPVPVPVEQPAPIPVEPPPPVAEEPPAEAPVPEEEPPAPAEEPPVPVEPPPAEAPLPPAVEAEPPVPPAEAEPPAPSPPPAPQPVVEPAPVIQPDIAYTPPVAEPQVIEASSVDLSTLAPDTPVLLDNGVVLTAEVVIALQLLENPAELLSELFTNPGQVLTAISNIGADMSPEVREKSEKIVVSAIIAGGIATQAAGLAASATYRRNP